MSHGVAAAACGPACLQDRVSTAPPHEASQQHVSTTVPKPLPATATGPA